MLILLDCLPPLDDSSLWDNKYSLPLDDSPTEDDDHSPPPDNAPIKNNNYFINPYAS